MTSAAVSLLSLVLVVCESVVPSTQSSTPLTDEFLGPAECLNRNFTRESCDLVFCPPWQRCVDGRCSCKPAHQCPREDSSSVCGQNGRLLQSYCQVMAASCQTRKPLMSHFGENCTADQIKFSTWIDEESGLISVFTPRAGSTGKDVDELLVCEELWDMAAANVACKEAGHPLGATSYSFLKRLPNYPELPSKCVSVRCQGYENSLAECVIYDKRNIDDTSVATATCEEPPPVRCEFRCVNRKCVSLSQTCDGVDHCGDRSDEMCCQKCRGRAFRCSTGVCLHEESVGDGQIDCLDGGDESPKHSKAATSLPRLSNTEFVSPKHETRNARVHLESTLACGIHKSASELTEEEEEVLVRPRVKRVVGGIPAKPTQIQWQAAIELNRRFHCGGVYIGGCWLLTAAHCFLTDSGQVSGLASWRPNLAEFKVKFSLWRRSKAQASTDIALVEDVRIHPEFDPKTKENDIALVQLTKPRFSDECLSDNSAISPICVPWTSRLFQPNHTCSVSGWGLNAGGRSPQPLHFANVSLIGDCQRFYNDAFKPGMICAGDLDGSVDSCQGDSGGPLVCEDELGVSYLWGIVSWGGRCAEAGFPGVYTEVARHFEWIRFNTGWSAVTKFNS